jgi:hypothetical protein
MVHACSLPFFKKKLLFMLVALGLEIGGWKALLCVVNEANKGIIDRKLKNVNVGENPLRCTT